MSNATQRSGGPRRALIAASSWGCLLLLILVEVNSAPVSTTAATVAKSQLRKPLDLLIDSTANKSETQASSASEQDEEGTEGTLRPVTLKGRKWDIIREKRSGISDQRLAELETFLALKRLRDREMRTRVPVAYGVFDPDKIGKRRRRDTESKRTRLVARFGRQRFN